MVQLSHPYMTTGKTIALSRRTFVGKVMSLLFSMLSAVATAAAKSLQLCPTLCNGGVLTKEIAVNVVECIL